MHGPAARWQLEHHLLAGLVNAERMALWQRGGGKGQRPKPVLPPGADGNKRMGTPRPIEEIREILDRVNGPRTRRRRRASR